MPRIPELQCPNVETPDPFRASHFRGDSSIFPVVSGATGHVAGETSLETCCRWSRVAGTLSSTPLVKGAEGLFYSSDLGQKGWGCLHRAARRFSKVSVVHFLS